MPFEKGDMTMDSRKIKIEKWIEEIIRKTSEEEEKGYVLFSQKYSRKLIKIPVKDYPSGDNLEQSK